MGLTPDSTPGPSDEEETQYEDRGPGGDDSGDPTVEGALRRVTNALRFFVGGTVRQILQIKNPPIGFDDVDLTDVAHGNGLSYNSTTKQFERQPFPRTSTEAPATGDITTTSTTPILATGMSITPGAGTYLVWFSAETLADDKSAIVTLQIHAAGVQIAERRQYTGTKDTRTTVALHAKVTVADAEAIEGFWSTSIGTATMGERSLMIKEVWDA